jgi:hypothetical protein
LERKEDETHPYISVIEVQDSVPHTKQRSTTPYLPISGVIIEAQESIDPASYYRSLRMMMC